MALHWNFTDPALHSAVLYKGRFGSMGQPVADPKGDEEFPLPHAEAAIFLTMSVGMNRITMDNVQKFATRVAAYEAVCGAMRWKLINGKREPQYMSVRECLTVVGLHTNASGLTDAAYVKRLGDYALREAHSRMAQEFEEAHAALKAA